MPPVPRATKARAARALAACALVVYWAVLTLGSQFAVDPPGILRDLWYSWGPLAFGWLLAFGIGVFVAR